MSSAFKINENGYIILSGNVTPLYFGGQVLFSMLQVFLLLENKALIDPLGK
jgi:hypothetical protein